MFLRAHRSQHVDESRVMHCRHLAILVVLGIGCNTRVSNEARDEVFTKIETSEVIECRVSIEVASHHTVEWRTRNRRMIEELVVIPLERARQDPQPAGYEAFGSLTLELKNGSNVFFFLFNPWGHVKRGNTYFIADLRELHHVVKASLDDSVGHIGRISFD